MSMFCYQMSGNIPQPGCTMRGVCVKSPELCHSYGSFHLRNERLGTRIQALAGERCLLQGRRPVCDAGTLPHQHDANWMKTRSRS